MRKIGRGRGRGGATGAQQVKATWITGTQQNNGDGMAFPQPHNSLNAVVNVFFKPLQKCQPPNQIHILTDAISGERPGLTPSRQREQTKLII